MTDYKAPWKIVYNTDYYIPDEEDLANRYILSIEDSAGGTVLYTESGWFKPDPDYAQLIEAAPELLEAVREWIEIANGGTTSAKYSAALDRARAAYSKATSPINSAAQSIPEAENV